MRKLPALTLIELIITIAIIGIIAIPLVIGVSSIRAKQALAADTDNLAGVFKQAHIYARESKDFSTWGVKATSDTSYLLMARDSSGINNKGEFVLTSPTIFDTGSFEVWFNQGTGDTRNGLTQIVILKTAAFTNSSQKITVTPNGVIEIE